MGNGFDFVNRPESTDDSEHGAVADLSTGRRFKKVQKVLLTSRIYSDANYTYHCESKPGMAVNSAFWRIRRIDATGNILFADGDDLFDNLATDLATVQGLSYS